MKKYLRIIAVLLFVVAKGYSQEIEQDTISSKDRPRKLAFDNEQDGTLLLNNPTQKKIEFDYKIGRYVIRQQIGQSKFSMPKYLTEEEYKDYRLRQDIQNYFKEKNKAIEGKSEDKEKAQKDLLPSLYVNNKFFTTLFGTSEISLVPRGSVTLRFGALYQNIENPILSEENRSSIVPEFDQQIRANLTAKIGDRLQSEINYDTQSTFTFQNQLKLEYEPGEDDILRSLEAGNINMDVKNNLISGAQSLFGVKTTLQFGGTTVTGVFSQQQSQSKNILAEGGSALTEFELRATQYDNNRHFFLAQYFRNNYNRALERLPLINSSVQITKVEVWITNRNRNTEDVRNIVGLVDLGESGTDVYDTSKSNISNTNNAVTQSSSAVFVPNNNENSLGNFVGTDKSNLRTIQNVALTLSNLEQGREYAIIENARKLRDNEYTFHPQLGYISLKGRLNDGDVLAVAYEYTSGGETYRVGELSTDGIGSDQNLVAKLIRPQLINTQDVVWNLLMKNIYNIGAFNLQREGFRFNVLYRDDQRGQATNNLFSAQEEGIRGRTLLNISRLDRLDPNNNETKQTNEVFKGDGFFDFIEGLTVDSENGTIIFPVIEPFGRDLEEELSLQEDEEKFVFNDLYTTTASVAENDFQTKDKFLLKGVYTSSAADGIPLGAFNVPRGSVTVTAGGIQLIEGVDYTVDYFAGRVKIINPAIQSSGQAINVSLENNTFFNQQRKTFIGVDVEHKFSDELVVGGTFLKVSERPITNKVQFGQDPINNSMYGLNASYNTEVPKLTELANYLPNIDTDAESRISVRGDFAYLRPNTPSSIDIGGEATTYLDDFEGSQIPINIGTAQSWSLSSVPVGFTDTELGIDRDFGVGREGARTNENNIASGAKRGKLSWYTIDQLFYSSSSLRPANIDPEELSRAEVRPVSSRELFPERSLDATQRTNLRTFDLTYYPTERGPYNYTGVSDELPDSNDDFSQVFGGITRGLLTTDFQRSNIQYIEFWLQDPYDTYSITADEADGVVRNSPANERGTLYLNLGSISEDILKDSRKGFENGLPETGFDAALGNDAVGVEKTGISYISDEKSLLYAFGQGDGARQNQDVGLDGVNDANEKFLLNLDATAPDLDYSADNYRFFRGSEYDNEEASILRRYKDFNNLEGNSPTAGLGGESFPTSATNNPDVEDADRDQTMNTVDSYWQYKIDLSQNNLSKERNRFIIDERTTTVNLQSGGQENFKWYLFRVPISGGESIGGINSFQSIRFMRMFLTDFEIPVNLRFADFQMVRGDWRIFDQVIEANDDLVKRDASDNTNLVETGVVNIEENENRVPVNYKLPPGITRENLQGTQNILQQNEQSLTVTVNNLEQNKTVGVFKNINTDMRMFKRLKMFIHAEELTPNGVENGDLVAVVRLGSDTSENFYQIEVPLTLTDIANFTSPNDISALGVWPEENSLNVELSKLTRAKLARDEAEVSAGELYSSTDGNATYSVKGNPNLSNIRTVFLGVKNLDTAQKSAEIWFNELRVAGFDNQGGWAAQISADATIADFARVAVNGGYQSIGFGGIDQSVNERSQEEIKNYSVNTSVNVGQLLPENWNIKLPVNYTISEEIRTPKFDPKYEDVLSKDAKDINPNSNSTDIISKRRSISLVNVKKDRAPGSERKPRPYDIENFSVSYNYSDATNENYTVETDLRQNVTASANYAYKFKPLEVKPFKNVKFLQSKHLSLLKDFNFNLLPTNIAINGAVKRNYSEYKTRDLSEPGEGSVPIPVLRQRNFMFDWDYRIGYKLSSAINVDFNANTNRIYDEFERDDTLSDSELDAIDLYSNFFNLGRIGNYNQNLTATYKLPINKLPFLDFVEADYSYTGNFTWRAASPDFLDDIGNTITNGATHNVSANLNFSKFYKSIGLNKLFKQGKRSRTPSLGAKGGAKKKVTVGSLAYGLLTSFKTARLSYNQNTTSSLDGYRFEPGFLGSNRFNNSRLTGYRYALGLQTDLNLSSNSDWLQGSNASGSFNKNYITTDFSSLNYDVTLKPIKDLNIQITGDRSFSENVQVRVDDVFALGANAIENKTGNFNISHSLIKTAINGDADVLFQNFIDNRAKITDVAAARASGATDEDKDRLESQALNKQETLIHSFLAAYGGNDVTTSKKSIFKAIPLPNWKLTYRGLMKLDFFKKRFTSFVVTHGYNSTYTINNFSSVLADDGANPFLGNTIYSGVTLIDAFNPLIKVDVKLKNSLSIRGTINTNRTLGLNLGNLTLSEINGREYVFGVGYRIKDVKIKTKFLRKRRTLKGDINIKADVSYKTDVTNIRSIDTGTNQPVGGQNLLGIKVAADYNLSRNFTASLYYDQNVASYAISTLYPRQSVNAGLSLVYNLGN